VKVVLTLLARDEADIVDAQIRYHLAAGIDFVIATDHRSVDGTSEILQGFESEGRLRYIRVDTDEVNQAEEVTRMARLAATEHDADWVVPSDADEFWWPRRGSVHEILESIPAQVGVVRGFIRTFVPRPADDRPFYERLTIAARPVVDQAGIYQPNIHVLHRAHPAVSVNRGSHDAVAERLGRLIRDWCPFEVLHFPSRTPDQIGRKYTNAYHGRSDGERGGKHVQASYRTLRETGVDELWRDRVVDGEQLDEGFRVGTYVVDERLRDVLRAIDRGEPPTFRPPTSDEDARFHVELGSMRDRDVAARLLDGAREAERRVRSLEQLVAPEPPARDPARDP
jgi:hypothetical protein